MEQANDKFPGPCQMANGKERAMVLVSIRKWVDDVEDWRCTLVKMRE